MFGIVQKQKLDVGNGIQKASTDCENETKELRLAIFQKKQELDELEKVLKSRQARFIEQQTRLKKTYAKFERLERILRVISEWHYTMNSHGPGVTKKDLTSLFLCDRENVYWYNTSTFESGRYTNKVDCFTVFKEHDNDDKPMLNSDIRVFDVGRVYRLTQDESPTKAVELLNEMFNQFFLTL